MTTSRTSWRDAVKRAANDFSALDKQTQQNTGKHRNFLQRGYDKQVQAVEHAGKAVVDNVSDAADAVAQKAKDVYDVIGGKVDAAGNAVADSAAVKAVSKVVQDLRSTGKAVYTPLTAAQLAGLTPEQVADVRTWESTDRSSPLSAYLSDKQIWRDMDALESKLQYSEYAEPGPERREEIQRWIDEQNSGIETNKWLASLSKDPLVGATVSTGAIDAARSSEADTKALIDRLSAEEARLGPIRLDAIHSQQRNEMDDALMQEQIAREVASDAAASETNAWLADRDERRELARKFIDDTKGKAKSWFDDHKSKINEREGMRQSNVSNYKHDFGAQAKADNPTTMDRLQSLLSEYAPNLIGGAAGTAGGYALSSLMDDDPDEEGISPEERQRRRSANRRRAALFSLGGAGVGAAAPYLNERFDILNNIKSRLGLA